LITLDDPDMTVTKQCELLGLSRSSYYYEPCCENPFYLEMMKQIDEIFTTYPFYGKRRISAVLKARGYNVGVDLARALMKRMGIEAICPRPNLSKPHPNHRVYPYLLKGVRILKKDQVWSTDITYLPMKHGFLYLTAVIDWYSRFVLAWKLSNSLDGGFCREVLLEALKKGKPDVFNTDQGSQYTSRQFTEILEMAGIRISMDGRGRALDNVWIERLWRTVKQEEVYIHDYVDGIEAYNRAGTIFQFLQSQTPSFGLRI
jgi:putative transposase